LLLDKGLEKGACRVGRRTHADEDQPNRENTSARAQWTHFPVPHRSERDNGHEERIEKRPPLNQHVPCCADHQGGDEGNQGDADAPPDHGQEPPQA